MPPKNKKGPTVISGKEFDSGDELTLETVSSWRVDSHDRAAETLLNEWDGSIIGLLGVTLSGDNRAIHNSTFLLQGTLYHTPKVVQANKFWKLPQNTEHEVIFSDIPCSLFKFTNSMVSNLVDSTDIEYSIRPVGKHPMVGTELDDISFRGFALRAYIWPTHPNWAKITVLLYPLPKDKLLAAHPLSVHAAFPGITAFSHTFPLGPPTLPGKKYGFPFTPAITPGASFGEFPNHPPAEEFIATTSALLRKTTYPEIKINHVHLQKRWEELSRPGSNPSSLKSQALTLVWPSPIVSVPVSQGRLVALFYLFLLVLSF